MTPSMPNPSGISIHSDITKPAMLKHRDITTKTDMKHNDITMKQSSKYSISEQRFMNLLIFSVHHSILVTDHLLSRRSLRILSSSG